MPDTTQESNLDGAQEDQQNFSGEESAKKKAKSCRPPRQGKGPKEGRKLPKNEIEPPSERGAVPISKKDGRPVELHHRGQNPQGPIDEMHASDHRFGPNYRANHPSTGPSKIDRSEFAKWKNEYWKRQWDSGRFDR
jgi:hypothetical protein